MRQIGCGAHGGITLALLLVVSTGSCASAPSNGTFALSEVDRRPRLVDRPHIACSEMRYPMPRDSILVRVDFGVDRSGTPVDLRARPHAYDSGPPIDATQRDDAVRQIVSCRFEPARLGGRPVAVTGMYMWARIPSGG